MPRKPIKKAIRELKRKLKDFLIPSDDEIIPLLNESENYIVEAINKNDFSLHKFYNVIKSTYEEIYKKSLSFNRFKRVFEIWVNQSKNRELIEDYLKFKSFRKPKNFDKLIDFLENNSNAILSRFSNSSDFHDFCNSFFNFYEDFLKDFKIPKNSICKFLALWLLYKFYKQSSNLSLAEDNLRQLCPSIFEVLPSRFLQQLMDKFFEKKNS